MRSASEDKARTKQLVGRWTSKEHEQFMECLKHYGRDWDKLEEMIPTRTNIQIRSHAQKFFERIRKEFNTEDPMDYVKKNLCDSSKIYKFDTFNMTDSGRAQEFAENPSNEDCENKFQSENQNRLSGVENNTKISKIEQLSMGSMRHNKRVDVQSSNLNKRILKMSRK